MIKISVVESKKDRKDFIMLPFELYRNNKYWIPPLIKDEYEIFEKESNPAMNFCDSCFWIAKENGKTLGRIAAIINYKYNEKIGEKKGRFYRFECINDQDVANALINTAERWLLENGMKIIHGPLGFTNLDLQGLLIYGFDQMPSIASVYHLDYYQKLIENCGYEKENDWLEFRLKIENHIPEKVERMVDLVKKRFGLSVINFKNRRALLPYANQLFDLLNIAFDDLPYVSKFDESTKEYYIKKYFSLLNPEYVKVILDNKENMRGFIVGMPSLSVAMQKCNGRLLPFGFLHILKALKKPSEMDLLLTGVAPHLQGQGVPAILIFELQQILIKYNIQFVETTGIFETNHKAIQTWKNYEHIQHKQRRCYVKKLSD